MDELAIEPRKRGRPHIIEIRPGIVEQLTGYIADGLHIADACVLCDINERDYFNMVQRAEAGNSSYQRFFHLLKRAEAEAKRKAIIKMRDEPKSFLGNATFLERRFRGEWGRSDKTTIDLNATIRVEQVDYVRLAKQIKPNKVK